MRAPSEELPIVLDGVMVTAGPVTILDEIRARLRWHHHHDSSTDPDTDDEPAA